ncbi:hypothetical protein BO70DRAFT_428105 [Aspergillus heteromorphus CBS 117.55]|uniref:Helix-turn-helix domain-containing protein n=1 Tax=Aspergillus heteromorphus CBS 117.55 TaxID=1448321 RepID=A0A317WP35_9EURO|nr:uncharacterized protein BO70DRAFT_428105 [Aspergillus heteromorphus CBS 117.55]PWY86030.1 hypothetical protein BO70DRAFT_428105 [Aspergillus heteromorphus CBS 117.55]
MGSTVSKPARSAVQAASKRQYPKQPTSPPTSSPAARPPPPPPPAQRAAQQAQQPQHQHQQQIPRRTPSAGPTYHSKEPPSTERSSAIDLDGRDPDFAASLRTIGPVTPNPTFSPSSTVSQTQSQFQFQSQPPSPYRPTGPPTGSGPSPSPGTGAGTGTGPATNAPTVFPPSSNPALLVFSARQQLARAAEQEAEAMGKTQFAGREFLDALTIRQALAMRDRQGLAPGEIERLLRLREGVVGRLGARGVVGDIG